MGEGLAKSPKICLLLGGPELVQIQFLPAGANVPETFCRYDEQRVYAQRWDEAVYEPGDKIPVSLYHRVQIDVRFFIGGALLYFHEGSQAYRDYVDELKVSSADSAKAEKKDPRQSHGPESGGDGDRGT